MGDLFQIHFWDQSHVNIVWNTRETGDIYSVNGPIGYCAHIHHLNNGCVR